MAYQRRQEMCCGHFDENSGYLEDRCAVEKKLLQTEQKLKQTVLVNGEDFLKPNSGL